MKKMILTASTAAIASLAAPVFAQEPAAKPQAAAQPHTQAAANGSYWIAPGDFIEVGDTVPADDASYVAIENFCLTADGGRFFGIHPATGAEPAFAVTEGGPIPVIIGDVEANADMRRYKIINPDNSHEFLTMNFIAQEAREAGQPNATAGLTNILARDQKQVNCIDNGQIVMIAASKGVSAVVTLEDNVLVLNLPDKNILGKEQVRGGYYSGDATTAVFQFFDGPLHLRFEMSAAGNIPANSMLFQGPGDQDTVKPCIYFIADPEMIGQRSLRMDPAVADVIGRLWACKELAGEASGDAGRTAELTEKAAENRCAALPAEHAAALASVDDQTPLHTFLELNAPN